MAGLLHKIHDKVDGKVHEIFGTDAGDQQHEQQSQGQALPQSQTQTHNDNRYDSFAPVATGGAKWYVDGASYFWAVSNALEEARESIYILDWWLSPELYLRRPPSLNESYRLDSMLKAAAERGVKINVIVYKEVEQALTLNSAHTKHVLEALHPNIKVFRHPDHIPNLEDARVDFEAELGKLSLATLNAFNLSTVSQNALKGLYGSLGETVLFWAHHEKLLIVDRGVGFLGGLDLCFGRYDTNSHPIADVHPGNLDAIIFPGQDYNNARIYDFEGVENWDHNKLDRTKSSRMGWSDISISVQGPIVDSLLDHFSDRWNFIFDAKYKDKDPGKYEKVATSSSVKLLQDARSQHHGPLAGLGSRIAHGDGNSNRFQASIQLCRSLTEWSSGHPTEHSIADAYIDVISNAEHYVYIENQFFITATSDEQHPVANKIGAAIVARIVKAHKAHEPFRVIVVMPSVPAFAGDLQSDRALGTRAIMEFQYNSINRGGHSIIEMLNKQGVEDAAKHITFYNLRNYDRINTSQTMSRVEKESGVQYEDARREHDDSVGAGNYPFGERSDVARAGSGSQYEQYQRAAAKVPDHTWDTVSACYMEAGPDLSAVPWQGSEESEIDAFVSEELYIHSKVLIADDKVVICGSANLNDRSQLGTHDSEIAVVIEDPEPIESRMNGKPFTASKFATSLRRQLFRKHLGLLPDQRYDSVTANWSPITRDTQQYDWASPADRVVADPMSPEFWDLWTQTARTNTEVFNKVFHPVPTDLVRSWDQYKDFFSRHFIMPGVEMSDEEKKGRVDYGHVVREEFPGGVKEVKEWLGRVRGSLVEMPLQFLIDVKDLAKEGLSLNSFTDELYT